MRSVAAYLFAALILVLVAISLFSRRIPASTQDVLYFDIVLFEVSLIVAGWWYHVRNKKAANVSTWRKRMALAGVIANTTAFVIPLGTFLYGVLFFLLRDIPLPGIGAERVTLVCLIFAFCGLSAALISPPRSRFVTSLGSLIIALLVLAFPIGVP